MSKVIVFDLALIVQVPNDTERAEVERVVRAVVENSTAHEALALGIETALPQASVLSLRVQEDKRV